MKFLVVSADGAIQRTCAAPPDHILDQLGPGCSAYALPADFGLVRDDLLCVEGATLKRRAGVAQAEIYGEGQRLELMCENPL